EPGLIEVRAEYGLIERQQRAVGRLRIKEAGVQVQLGPEPGDPDERVDVVGETQRAGTGNRRPAEQPGECGGEEVAAAEEPGDGVGGSERGPNDRHRDVEGAEPPVHREGEPGGGGGLVHWSETPQRCGGSRWRGRLAQVCASYDVSPRAPIAQLAEQLTLNQ